jgi:hypothetical protein
MAREQEFQKLQAELRQVNDLGQQLQHHALECAQQNEQMSVLQRELAGLSAQNRARSVALQSEQHAIGLLEGGASTGSIFAAGLDVATSSINAQTRKSTILAESSLQRRQDISDAFVSARADTNTLLQQSCVINAQGYVSQLQAENFSIMPADRSHSEGPPSNVSASCRDSWNMVPHAEVQTLRDKCRSIIDDGSVMRLSLGARAIKSHYQGSRKRAPQRLQYPEITDAIINNNSMLNQAAINIRESILDASDATFIRREFRGNGMQGLAKPVIEVSSVIQRRGMLFDVNDTGDPIGICSVIEVNGPRI